ncbi:MAG: hypothetical protein WA231_20295 [Methylocella sp.]
MIAVAMEALQDLADKPIGVIVSFDQVFDAVENDLLSQEYLGASGAPSTNRMSAYPGMPVESSRVLKIAWLLQRITWVPRVPGSRRDKHERHDRLHHQQRHEAGKIPA